jgi:phenylacetate-CoA ligase
MRRAGLSSLASRTTVKHMALSLKSRPAGDRLVRRNPVYFRQAIRLFDRLEGSSLDERISWSEKRLQIVLRRGSTTGYGRSSGGERLDDWPLLEKSTVRDRPEAFVGGRRALTAHASTSGTTGLPLSLVRSPRSVVVEQAAIDRLVRTKGIELGRARIAVFRGDNVSTPEAGTQIWRDDLGGRRRVFSSNHLSPQTVDVFADALEEFDPACLLAYPTVLESLTRLLERRERDVTIPVTLTSSEMLSTAARRIAETVLHTQVIDYYGQAERVSFAYSFAPEVYTFLPGYGITELVRVRGDEQSDLFEIVGTSLWNLAMPLIRYRTGDIVALPKNAPPSLLDEVCYGTRSVSGIEGRSDDFLVSASGGRLVGIDHIPRDVDHVLRLQVVQEDVDHVRVLVLAAPRFGDADRQQIETNLLQKIPPTMRYSVEVVESLERRGGKTPLVIRRPSVDASRPPVP